MCYFTYLLLKFSAIGKTLQVQTPFEEFFFLNKNEKYSPRSVCFACSNCRLLDKT